MKARFARPKDDRDLEEILPRLDAVARSRLREAIQLVHPEHRWLEGLADPDAVTGPTRR